VLIECVAFCRISLRVPVKSDILQGYGDTVLRTEALEKELDKLKKHATLLQSKLDGTFAQYHNEVQKNQANRDDLIRKKSLRQKN
jgi:hypothetical protein